MNGSAVVLFYFKSLVFFWHKFADKNDIPTYFIVIADQIPALGQTRASTQDPYAK